MRESYQSLNNVLKHIERGEVEGLFAQVCLEDAVGKELIGKTQVMFLTGVGM